MCVQENILKAAQWLMTGCQAGDSLVFAFCGRAASGDLASLFEGDVRAGEEEGLLPSDYERVRAIQSNRPHWAGTGACLSSSACTLCGCFTWPLWALALCPLCGSRSKTM